MNTYRNPWYRPNGGGDPEIYRTDAKPVHLGKYQRFHRIKGSNKSGHCYDYVLNGVCVTQRCGQVDEAFLDADERTQETILRFLGTAAHTRCDDSANPSGPVSCGNTPVPAL